MTPKEFSRRQRGIRARLSKQIRRLIFLRGAPATAAEREALAMELFPLVQRERVESYRFAQAMLIAEAKRLEVPQIPSRQMRPYKPDALVKVLERATGVGEQGQRVEVRMMDPETRRTSRQRVTVTERNQSDPVVVKQVAERVSRVTVRHAQQAGRELVEDTADAADEKVGWARVLTGAENCAFCALLVSRGPTYSSKNAASVVVSRRAKRKVGAEYHDNCDCYPVLVVKGKDWEGREEYERLEKLWIDSTKRVYGKAKVKAFAQAWRADQAQRQQDQAAQVAA